jgi:3-dehydroquinate dehydratase-1
LGEVTKMPSRPRIIGVVTAANRNDDKAWEALADCDMAEFRGDTFAGPDSAEELPGLLKSFRDEGARRLGRIPETLFTLRLRRDGGEWPEAEAKVRVPVWQSLSRTGAPEWVDIEVEEKESLPASLSAAGSRVIVSHHDFKGTPGPEGLRRLRASMLESRPAAIKFAVTCRTRAEVLDLLAFARESASGGIFSMGAVGKATRVLAPLLGCPFTYGYLSGAPVAPGQLSAAELRAFFTGAPYPPTPDPEALLDWAEGRLQEAGHAR